MEKTEISHTRIRKDNKRCLHQNILFVKPTSEHSIGTIIHAIGSLVRTISPLFLLKNTHIFLNSICKEYTHLRYICNNTSIDT